jgi:hypothetical protein
MRSPLTIHWYWNPAVLDWISSVSIMTLTTSFSEMGSGVIVANRMVARRCGGASLGEEDPLPGAELELHPMNRRGRTTHSDGKNLAYTTC